LSTSGTICLQITLDDTILVLFSDLQPNNLGLNSAWKYAQDREHWKHLVETTTLQLGACTWWWCIVCICLCL